MAASDSARFPGLVDLANERLGGRALACSDDFFAPMQAMLKAEKPAFDPNAYTDRGKLMDGWESRRKRVPGYDHCIVELGCAGRVVGFDIDTSYFLGNHPPYASVDGLYAPKGTAALTLQDMAWRELLGQSPLMPGAQNVFITSDLEPVSHVRLNIFPDGGVARFRVYGHVTPDWSRARLDAEAAAAVPKGAAASEWLDLAALTSGGMTVACSDAFYGPTTNMILPGRAENMGGGWETRRRRVPGVDWVIFRLGARGTPRMLELDTNHFKGNFPDRCSLEVLDTPPRRITELIASQDWRAALPETKLRAHARQFFPLELASPVTYLRLNVIPDGGVSRVRVWGTRDG
jgi:allantoicase